MNRPYKIKIICGANTTIVHCPLCSMGNPGNSGVGKKVGRFPPLAVLQCYCQKGRKEAIVGRKQEAMNRERVLRELAAIGFARLDTYLQIRNGELVVKDTDAMTPQELAAVASVERSSTGLKLKFYDKMKALELLGKAMGVFENGGAAAEDTGLLQAILDATADAGKAAGQ